MFVRSHGQEGKGIDPRVGWQLWRRWRRERGSWPWRSSPSPVRSTSHPRAHAAYAELGFNPSPGSTRGGVALPDGPAYFASRGSLLGQVPGEVVAAAFGVFNPAVVVPAVTWAWTKVDAPTICAARTRGGVAQLERVLGPAPDGLGASHRALGPGGRTAAARGQAALRRPARPGPARRCRSGDMWRLADTLREYRGDAHIAAWTSAGLDATEVGLLTELYWRMPLRTYIRTRAWSDARPRRRRGSVGGSGLLSDGALTPEGRASARGESRCRRTRSARSSSTRWVTGSTSC